MSEPLERTSCTGQPTLPRISIRGNLKTIRFGVIIFDGVLGSLLVWESLSSTGTILPCHVIRVVLAVMVQAKIPFRIKVFGMRRFI